MLVAGAGGGSRRRSSAARTLQLADHQKIRAAVALARTRAAAHRRHAQAEAPRAAAVAGGPADVGHAGAAPAADARSRRVLARFAPGRTIAPTTTIDELGLSSLERVELMMALEEAFQVTVDEARSPRPRPSATSRRSRRPLEAGQPPAGGRDQPSRSTFPPGTAPAPCAALRRASLPTWILPLGAHLRAARGRRPRAPRVAAGARSSSPPTIRATSIRR